jgi:hypothetical protein
VTDFFYTSRVDGKATMKKFVLFAAIAALALIEPARGQSPPTVTTCSFGWRNDISNRLQKLEQKQGADANAAAIAQLQLQVAQLNAQIAALQSRQAAPTQPPINNHYYLYSPGGPPIALNPNPGPTIPLNPNPGPAIPFNPNPGPVIPLNPSPGPAIPFNPGPGPGIPLIPSPQPSPAPPSPSPPPIQLNPSPGPAPVNPVPPPVGYQTYSIARGQPIAQRKEANWQPVNR